MARVYPNHSGANGSSSSSSVGSVTPAPAGGGDGEGETVLTVWRKSLLLNFGGFTVFDGKGDLVFRVDNYSSASNGEIMLMDASGKSLLTLRRKRLSLGENWLIYHGDEAAGPRFSVKKRVPFLPSKGLASVTSRGIGSCSSYSVVGSYSRLRCTVYDGLRRPIVVVRRKEAASGVALGGDVFLLTILPGFDASLAMAMVIALEQMFH
ncbi:protein LURP-one-related 8-like [Iris pallida]|uniref:Protein LURP-one-related 8-like n=1 Tax=Iris pallida TaxID=29817 RepID=A0AAX6HE06_IRIPA|nr:protein LURP-one-related 8-like [Iris pallida]KAJ6839310.1 protein LURP-one-related 8-like [Iris pallida]